MIELKGFGWRHAGRRAWAIRGVDLRIERGERVLLLGPSGAGKSTLLHAIAGLLPEDSGEREGTLTIGTPGGVFAPRSSLAPRRDATVDGRSGIVFQDPQSQLVMTRAGDEVAFGLENLGWPRPELWSRVDSVLAGVGFGYPKDRPTGALSGGEQQRLVLAGALAPAPGVLLLDEPTANLDPAGAAMVRETLRDLDRDTTIVLVEHRIAEVMDLVTRVVVLSPGGGIGVDGPPSLLTGPVGIELAAAGVWVPGHPLPPRAGASIGGDPLIWTEALTSQRLSEPFPDLVARAGEALAVTGANGTGKSTLALLLGGLTKPAAGSVRTTWGDHPHRWRARPLAARIGSVFQNPQHQFVTNTVRGELELGGTAASRVDELLSRLHLDHLARANPFTLSGGEGRRLSVATALAARPRLLILDEPTFGQDRRTWIELVDLLGGLRDDGHAIIAVTHDAEVVSSLADRTLTLGAS